MHTAACNGLNMSVWPNPNPLEYKSNSLSYSNIAQTINKTSNLPSLYFKGPSQTCFDSSDFDGAVSCETSYFFSWILTQNAFPQIWNQEALDSHGDNESNGAAERNGAPQRNLVKVEHWNWNQHIRTATKNQLLDLLLGPSWKMENTLTMMVTP